MYHVHYVLRLTFDHAAGVLCGGQKVSYFDCGGPGSTVRYILRMYITFVASTPSAFLRNP